jgi:bifunctional non-homologous end joining protein LigD
LSTYFPDIVAGCSAHGQREAIFDGEIIVLDDRTRPNFQLLQRRLHTPRPGRVLQRSHPARLVVFDVLHLDGRDLTPLPYRDRRAILEGLELGDLTSELATSPAWPGADGHEILQAMADVGMEGVVCKAVGSSYRAGQRSRHWIKTPYHHTSFFAVGGYFASSPGSVGALLVGAYDAAGDFTYCGTVSVGFTARARRDLSSQLARWRQDASPFRCTDLDDHDGRPHWVQPVVVGRIEFREFTGRLRHAAWKGVVDVDARAVGLPVHP